MICSHGLSLSLSPSWKKRKEKLEKRDTTSRPTDPRQSSRTYIDIVAPTWRIVSIRARIHKQRVRPGASTTRRRRSIARTDVKGPLVPIRKVRVRPGHRVAREGKRAIGVRRGGEPGLEGPLRGVAGGVLDPQVQRIGGPGAGVVDELAVEDVELAGGGAGVEDGVLAWGRCREGLEVGVVVGRFDGADPVPAGEEGGGCA